MTFGSLFAGIGGFDLGLERAGWTCRWQVENNPYSIRVLEKHWPDVKRYGDITELDAAELESVDLICGGFPCQDISAAGRGAGIHGERSGLWKEFARVLEAVRPRFALIENSPALRGRGLAVVLQDLHALGFDAEWHCVPASAFGAPHIRDRIWVIAHTVRGGRRQGLARRLDEPASRTAITERSIQAPYAVSEGRRERGQPSGVQPKHSAAPSSGDASNAHRYGRYGRSGETTEAGGSEAPPRRKSAGPLLTNPPSPRLFAGQSEASRALWDEARRQESQRRSGETAAPDADGEPLVWSAIAREERHAWTAEPGVARMVHGVPARVDRIRGLGNAVVPQVVEWIGRELAEAV